MVRRVGFGNTPEPEKRRKPRKSPASNETATRPAPVSSTPKSGASIAEARFDKNRLMFKIAQIVVVAIIAIRIESNIMFIILFLWVTKEIWSLLRKTPAPSANPDQ